MVEDNLAEVLIGIYSNENKDPYVARIRGKGISTFRVNSREDLIANIRNRTDGRKVYWGHLYFDPIVHEPEWEVAPLPQEEYDIVKAGVEHH